MITTFVTVALVSASGALFGQSVRLLEQSRRMERELMSAEVALKGVATVLERMIEDRRTEV